MSFSCIAVAAADAAVSNNDDSSRWHLDIILNEKMKNWWAAAF